MKKLFICLLFFQMINFAQFDELKVVSLEDRPHSDFKKSFLFQSNDSLFYFYKNPSNSQVLCVDLRIGTAGMQPWQRLHEITFKSLLFYGERAFDIHQKDNNTFLIVRQFLGDIVKIFQYDVTKNTLKQLGISLPESGSEIEFTYIDDSTFILSMKDTDNNVFYYTTTDAAASWSEKQYFTNVATNDRALKTVLQNGVYYTSLVSEDSLSIDLLKSTDFGANWNILQNIYTGSNKVSSPSIHINNSNLYLVFEEYLYVDLINDFQTDISYIISTDNASSWDESVKYTSFIGNDIISGINLTNSSLLVLILSSRIPFEIGKFDTYVGILTSTVDPAPPAVYSYNIPSRLYFDQDFALRLFVDDESGISSVNTIFDNTTYELFDDGNHNDSLAGDNIYGNIIAGYSSNNPNDAARMDINNISMPFSNNGVLADVNERANPELTISIKDINGNDLHFTNIYSIWSEEGTLGRYKGKGFLFSGGFFLSGYSDLKLWGNGAASVLHVLDYTPGPIDSNPNDENNLIYSVSASDVPFGNSWQNWVKAVEQGAYFYDGDNDGIYNPNDKNRNGVWDPDEDKPDILFDITYFTVYNDGVPASERWWESIADPLGIEIRQSVFASKRNSVLEDVFFVRYSIVYKGLSSPNEPDSLTDVVFSLYTDDDIGSTASAAGDDKVGCDTTLQAGYGFNDGEDDDWGTNPPAIFKTVVQGPIVKSGNPNDIAYNKFGPDLGSESYPGFKNLGMTSFVAPQKATLTQTEPLSYEEVRNYALGFGQNGEIINPCNFVYGEIVGNVDCSTLNPKYWFSGDPVTNNGWLYSPAQDIRNMVNTGSFTLHKNEPMDIIVAYVVGQGNDALNSITKAREITQYVHEEYARNFSTLVGVEDNKKEVVKTFSLSQNYPNPFNPTTTIKFSIPNVGTSRDLSPQKTSIIIYDILGRKVKTLVNEMKTPGNYEVNFDASQLASGVYFYRLESGSFIQTKKMMLLK